MSKKTIIEVVVISIAFLGSGIVLYKGFGGTSTPVDTITSATVTVQDTKDILPYGDKFDYQKIDDLKKKGFVFGSITYPVLSSSTEIGKTDINDLMQPKVNPAP